MRRFVISNFIFTVINVQHEVVQKFRPKFWKNLNFRAFCFVGLPALTFTRPHPVH